jgi:hypothetical protein
MGDDEDKTKSVGSMPFFLVHFVEDDAERQGLQQDESYIKRFGWLSARFRRTRWWFFAVWVIYQFVRACFIGGARESPTAQVVGLFVWEIIAFVVLICINPFEGARNTALAVYMLGVSKVATAGLSIAFLPQLNVPRIPATVIGVVIIVIQGFLVIGLMILVFIGAISSYMSLTRNREQFRPHGLKDIRIKYFETIERKATDLPPPPPPVPEAPKEPYFSVVNVRRAPKIEDEDDIFDVVPDITQPGAQSQASLANRASRAGSVGSHPSVYGNVPFGARVHRASWSSREFHSWQEERSNSPLRPASLQMSGHNTANNSVSQAPLIRSTISHSSLRPSTPTKEQRKEQATEQPTEQPTEQQGNTAR